MVEDEQWAPLEALGPSDRAAVRNWCWGARSDSGSQTPWMGGGVSPATSVCQRLQEEQIFL